jgi:TP901 family phage tail tape measure protein
MARSINIRIESTLNNAGFKALIANINSAQQAMAKLNGTFGSSSNSSNAMAQRAKQIADSMKQATAEATAAATAIDKMNASMAKTGNSAANKAARLQAASAATNALMQNANRASTSLTRLGTAAQRTSTQVGQSTSAAGRFGSAVSRWMAPIASILGMLNRLANALGRTLVQSLVRATSAVLRFISAGARFAAMKATLDSTGRSFSMFGMQVERGMRQANRSVMEFYAAGWSLLMGGQMIGGAGRRGIGMMGGMLNDFLAYEQQRTRLGIAAIDFNNPQPIAQSNKLIDEMIFGIQRGQYGAPVPMSAAQLAEGAYYYQSAIGTPVSNKQQAEQLAKIITPILQTAAFTRTQPETAMKGVLNAAMMFGIDPRQTHQVAGDGQRLATADVMRQITASMGLLTNISTLEFPDIAETFKMMGPMMNLLSGGDVGQGLNEAMLWTFLASDMGLRGSLVGRGFNQAMNSLLDPTARMDKTANSLWGADARDVFFNEDGLLKGGLRGFIEQFGKDKLDDSEWMQAAAEFFTTNATRNLIPVIEAFRNDPEKIAEFEKMFSDGSPLKLLEEATARYNDSIQGHLDQVRNAWFEVQNAIISSIEGPFKSALSGITEVFRAIADALSENPAIARFAAGLAAIGSAVMVGIGGMLTFAGTVLILARAFAMAHGSMALLLRFAIAIPMLLASVIPLILALAAGAILLRRAWDSNFLGIREKVEEFRDGFAETLSDVMGRVERFSRAVAEFFEAFVNQKADEFLAWLDTVGQQVETVRRFFDAFAKGTLVGFLGTLLAVAAGIRALVSELGRIVDAGRAVESFIESLTGLELTATNVGQTLGLIFGAALAARILLMLPPVQMVIAAFTRLASAAVLLAAQTVLLGFRMAALAVSFAATAAGAFLALSPIAMLGIVLAAAAIGIIAFIGYTQGLGAVVQAASDVLSGFLAVAIPIGETLLRVGAVIAVIAAAFGKLVYEIAGVLAPLLGLRNEFEVLGAAIALVVGVYLTNMLVGGLTQVIAKLGIATLASAAFSAKMVLGFGAVGVAIMALAPHFDTLTGWLDALDEKLTGGMIGDALEGKGEEIATGGVLAALMGRGLLAKGAAGLGGLLMTPTVATGLGAAGLAGLYTAAGYELYKNPPGEKIPTDVDDYFGGSMSHIAGLQFNNHSNDAAERTQVMQALSRALMDSQQAYGYVPDNWQLEAKKTGFSADEIQSVLSQMPHGRVTTKGEAGSIALNLVQDYAEMATSINTSNQKAVDDLEAAKKESQSIADKGWGVFEDIMDQAGLGKNMDDVKGYLSSVGVNPDIGDFTPEIDSFMGLDPRGEYRDELTKMLGPEMAKWLGDQWDRSSFENVQAKMGDKEAQALYDGMGIPVPQGGGQLSQGGLEDLIDFDEEALQARIQQIEELNNQAIESIRNMSLPQAVSGALKTQFQNMSLGEGMAMWGDLFQNMIPEGAEWSNIFEGIADVVGYEAGKHANILGKNMHNVLRDSDGFQNWAAEMGLSMDEAIADIPKFMHAEELIPQAFQGLLTGIDAMGPQVYEKFDHLGQELGFAGVDMLEVSQFAISKAMAGQSWDFADYIAEAWDMEIGTAEEYLRANGIDPGVISSDMFMALDMAIASSFGQVNVITDDTLTKIEDWATEVGGKVLEVTREEFNSLTEAERISLSGAGFMFVLTEDDVQVDTEGGQAAINKGLEGLGQSVMDHWTNYDQPPLDIRQPVTFTLEVEGGVPKIEGSGKTPGTSLFTPYIPPDLLNPPVIRSVQKVEVTTDVTYLTPGTGTADKNWSPVAAGLGLASKNNTAGGGGVYTFPPISAVQEVQVATVVNEQGAIDEVQAKLDAVKDVIDGLSLPVLTLTQEVEIDYVVPGAASGFPMGTSFPGGDAAPSGITIPITADTSAFTSAMVSVSSAINALSLTTFTAKVDLDKSGFDTSIIALSSALSALSLVTWTATVDLKAGENIYWFDETLVPGLQHFSTSTAIADVDIQDLASADLESIVGLLTIVDSFDAVPTATLTDSASEMLRDIIGLLTIVDSFNAVATATVLVSGLGTAQSLLNTLYSLDGYHASSSASFTQTTILQTIDQGTRFFGFAEGGVHRGPSPYAVVGEEGPELIKMPFGTRIYPHDESMRMLSQMASSPVRTESYANAFNGSGGSAGAAGGQPSGDVNITFNGDMHFQTRADVDYLVDSVIREMGRKIENAERIMPTDGGRIS